MQSLKQLKSPQLSYISRVVQQLFAKCPHFFIIFKPACCMFSGHTIFDLPCHKTTREEQYSQNSLTAGGPRFVEKCGKKQSWSQFARWPGLGLASDLWRVWVTAEQKDVQPSTVNGLFDWNQYTSSLLFYTHTVGTYSSGCGQMHLSNAHVENARARAHTHWIHTHLHTQKMCKANKHCKWPWQH